MQANQAIFEHKLSPSASKVLLHLSRSETEFHDRIAIAENLGLASSTLQDSLNSLEEKKIVARNRYIHNHKSRIQVTLLPGIEKNSGKRKFKRRATRGQRRATRESTARREEAKTASPAPSIVVDHPQKPEPQASTTFDLDTRLCEPVSPTKNPQQSTQQATAKKLGITGELQARLLKVRKTEGNDKEETPEEFLNSLGLPTVEQQISQMSSTPSSETEEYQTAPTEHGESISYAYTNDRGNVYSYKNKSIINKELNARGRARVYKDKVKKKPTPSASKEKSRAEKYSKQEWFDGFQMAQAYESKLREYLKKSPHWKYFKGAIDADHRSFAGYVKAANLANKVGVTAELYMEAQFFYFDQWFTRAPKSWELSGMNGKFPSDKRVAEFIQLKGLAQGAMPKFKTVTPIAGGAPKKVSKRGRYLAEEAQLQLYMKKQKASEAEVLERCGDPNMGMFCIEFLRSRPVWCKLVEEGVIPQSQIDRFEERLKERKKKEKK